MTSRERFRRAAARERADRAVFDLGGSPQTLIDDPEVLRDMAELLGIGGDGRGPMGIDERILAALDIDTRRVGGMPTPPTAHERREGDILYDAWGIGYREADGRWEICHNPLRDATLDDMMDYEFPDPERVDRSRIAVWAAQAEALHAHTDCAVIAEHPVLGVFELGCWMFGFDDYLYRLAGEPEVVHAFSGRVLAYQKRIIELYYGALGRYIDGTTSGDDFGMQNNAFLSPRMFEGLIQPYLRERIRYTHTFTDCAYQHHTCGSVHGLIPHLIACGVDILNPIQPNAHMMEPERLAADYGDRIAFWGGIDTQHILPEGGVEDVKAEVRRVLGILDGCGYILAPAHTIQRDVPARNVIAIYQGAKEHYGI